MVQVKKMNESFFAKILKEFNVAGELVRARRYEIFTVLCEFNLSDLESWKYQSNMKPHSALQSIL